MAKTLVAYFSATGTTARAAQKLGEAVGADLYEIKPKTAYTSADLNWNNRSSRSSVEMNDPGSRPELADRDAPIGDYDTIFIGFPIWWYTAPRIINSFLDAYDFSGKKLALFATSGGSGLGRTANDLMSSHTGIAIVDGRLLNGHMNTKTLKDWVESI